MITGNCLVVECTTAQIALFVGSAPLVGLAVTFWISGVFFSQVFGKGDDHVGTLVLASRWNADHNDSVTATHAVVLDNQRVGTVDLVVVEPTP